MGSTVAGPAEPIKRTGFDAHFSNHDPAGWT